MIKKLILLNSLIISIGLLSVHALFAQSHTTPLNQSSVLVDEYSNISKCIGNGGRDSIFPTNFQADFAPQMQMDPTIVEGVEEILGLEEFRQAIKDHPTAEQLVIYREGETLSIRPPKANPNAPKAAVHNENRAIIDRLRSLLPPEVADDPLLKYQLSSNGNGVRVGVDPLSAVRLSEILNKLDTTNFPPNISSAIFAENNNKKVWNPLLSTAKGVGNILGVRKKGEAIPQINAVDSIPIGSAEEAAYIEAALFKYAMIGRNENDMIHLYQEVDMLWAQAQEIWDRREITQQEAEVKTEDLNKANEILEQEETARKEKDIKQTVLGRFARVAELAAVPLSFAPVPFAGGAANAVSAIAGTANHVIADAPVMLAKRAVKNATQVENLAKEEAKSIEITAPEMEIRAENAEEEAININIKVTMDTAKSLKPPVNKSEKDAWNTWASNITETTGLHPTWISKIARKGKDHITWAAEIAKATWKERIRLSEEYINKLENGKDPDIKQFNILKKDFEYANTVRETTKKMAKEYQEALQKAIQDKIDAEVIHKKANDEFTAFNKKHKNTQTLSLGVDSRPYDTEEKKGQIMQTLKALKKANDAFEKAKKLANDQKLDAIAAKEEKNRFSKLYFDQKKIVLRKIKRAKAHIKADKEAWNAIWPEEVKMTTVEHTEQTTSKPEMIALSKLELKDNEAASSPKENFLNNEISPNTTDLLLSTSDQVNKIDLTTNTSEADFHNIEINQFTEIAKVTKEVNLERKESIEIEKLSIEPKIKVAETATSAKAAENKAETTTGDESYYWYKVAASFQRASDSWFKVIEAETARNQKLAFLWTKVAKQSEFIAKQLIISTQSDASKSEQGVYYSNGGNEFIDNSIHYLSQTAEYLNKARKSQALENSGIAALWIKLAEQSQNLAENYQQGAQTYVSGNKEEIEPWNAAESVLYNMGCCLSNAAEYLSNANQLQSAKNSETAPLWIKLTEQSQDILEYYKQYAQCYISENTMKEHLFGTKRTRWDGTTNYIESSIKCLSDASKYILKAVEAKSLGNTECSDFWIKAAEQSQEAVESNKQSITAHMAGTWQESECWNRIARDFEESAKHFSEVAEYLNKAIETSNKGHVVIAALWTRTAELSKLLVENYKQYVQVGREERTQANSKESYRLYKEATTLKENIEYLSQFAERLTKAAEAQAVENVEIASLWIKAVQLKVLAKESPRNEYLEERANCLAQAADWLSKSEEANNQGNEDFSSLWIRASAQSKALNECYKLLSDQIKKSKNNEETQQMRNTDWFLSCSDNRLFFAAEFLMKAVEAQAAENVENAFLWAKAASAQQDVAECYRQCVLAYFEGNTEDRELLEKTCTSLEKNAEASKISAEQFRQDARIFLGEMRKDFSTNVKENIKENKLFGKNNILFKENTDAIRVLANEILEMFFQDELTQSISVTELTDIKAEEIGYITTAKKAIVKAKRKWDAFSQATDCFMSKPNLTNIEAVNRSALWSSYGKHIPFFPSADYTVVNAISRVLDISANDSANPVMIVFRRAYSVRYNAHEVIRDRFNTQLTGRCHPSTDKAQQSAKMAEEAAINAIGTIWEEETRWAANVARKAADFTKAVDQWVLFGKIVINSESEKETL